VVTVANVPCWRSAFLVTAVTAGVVLSGCGSASGPSAHESRTPEETVREWMTEAAQGNCHAVAALMVPTDRDLLGATCATSWVARDRGENVYTHVHCKAESISSSQATLSCTFALMNPSPDMEGVDFWSFTLQRANGGPWMISSYGQP
jgi:hypothetical protein